MNHIELGQSEAHGWDVKCDCINCEQPACGEYTNGAGALVCASCIAGIDWDPIEWYDSDFNLCGTYKGKLCNIAWSQVHKTWIAFIAEANVRLCPYITRQRAKDALANYIIKQERIFG